MRLEGSDAPPIPNAIEVAVHRLRKTLAALGATIAIHSLRATGYLVEDGGE